MTAPARIPGFRGEFLWELDIVTRQDLAMAEAIPAEKYDWRPEAKARSVSEVFVHVASGNFMLLDVIGWPAPADLYGQVPTSGRDHIWGMIHRNDEMMLSVRDKSEVVALLKRSLQTVEQAVTEATDADFERSVFFFGEQTTVRRAYLRILVHMHEHMGQMVAYLRSMGIATPWPDWRPDRRPANE